MNYLIFDNEVYYDAGDKKGSVSRQDIRSIFKGTADESSIAVIDTLQKQIVAPQKDNSRKEEALSSAFTGEYVTQSEQTGNNLFQVIAIEKTRITEIYKYLGFENVRLVVPYAVAVREFLKASRLFEEKKRIVFLDDLGNQVLLTIFNNDVFTSPRRLSIALKRVVSELTRSQENYRAQNKDETEIQFLIVTNSKEIMEEVVALGKEREKDVVFVPDPYPALTGLKHGRFSMHYLLPEQFIRLRKLHIFKKRLFNLGIMGAVSGALLFLFLVSFNMNKNALMHLKELRFEEASLNEALTRAYSAKYKDILRRGKKPDFPYFVGSFIEAIPCGYKAESITIKNLPGGSYRFEAIVSKNSEDESFVGFLLPPPFKQAKLENILVRGSPGIRVVLDIF